MRKSRKTGRNQPCPCGSGRKYKKCCLRPRLVPPDAVVRQHQAAIEREQQRTSKFGRVRAAVHAQWRGKRYVAVGNELYESSQWKTFPDFLWDYIKGVLTPEWGKAELAKPLEQRHIILQWYDRLCAIQRQYGAARNEDGVYGFVPDGAAAAYLLLAYDLYVLRHDGTLQDAVVRRLKDPMQFQGARHELFVAATCIRAGFELRHEDESDSSRKHPEFLAKDPKTGVEIWVEAKSMHRSGVLGQALRKEQASTKSKAGRLLRDAAKKTTGPLVAFVDVNLPGDPRPDFAATWRQDVLKSFDGLRTNLADGLDPINLAVFTNFPLHYGDEPATEKWKDVVAVFAGKPRYPVTHSSLLDQLADAARLFGHLPQTLEEAG